VAVQAKGGKEARARPKRAPGSRLTQDQIDEIFRRFQKADPHPKTELHYRDPFTLLVAVVLSAQATDASVNRATPELFRIADTPEKLAALGEAGLEAKIKTIGLYRSKARNLIALSKKLVAEHGSKVPETREVLMSLPGVGRKTANVVLGTAFGIDSGIVVDTHVQRIARRLDLSKQTDPVKIEKDLMRVVPRSRWILFSHQVTRHGRGLCPARKPRCPACPLDPICYASDKTS